MNNLRCKICGRLAIDKGLCIDCLTGPANKKPVPPPKPKEPTFFYNDPETRSFKIERLMRERGVLQIGDQAFMWKKYDYESHLQKDPTWSPLTHYTVLDRCIRTVYIKQLTEPALKRVHEAEVKRASLFNMAIEMDKLRRASKEVMEKITITGDDWKMLKEFNRKNKPIYDERKFEGIPIPPNFEYDCEFDGIEYNHAWDWSVWTHVLEFKTKKPKTVAQQLEALT